MLAALSVVMLLLSAGAIAILRSIKHAQEQITRESLKMNAFDFRPHKQLPHSGTSVRCWKAWRRRRRRCERWASTHPSILCASFTATRRNLSWAENFSRFRSCLATSKDSPRSPKLTPNQLAHVLGLYLEELSRIIQRETNGTIDKYIGDAIMTIWNAPEPVPEHPKMACLAALRCRDAAAALARTPDWRHLPPFQTRFGLHCSDAGRPFRRPRSDELHGHRRRD